MKIINFSYTKILAEKNSSDFKDLKIGSSINIESIEEPKNFQTKTKDDILIVNWSYSISYSPTIANLSFSGSLVLAMDQKESKEILSNWKNKKLTPDFNLFLVNVIMRKVNIKALQFEDELNLPTHFKLPSVKLDKKD